MHKTKIEVVAGYDRVCPVPKMVRAGGLSCRVALIQHTYRPDSPDMYFDQPLLECLIKFAGCFGGGLDIRILESEEASGASPEVFLAKLNKLREVDREPPAFIVVRKGQELVLCIATEYWANVGGPAPYADSYTYSVFSKSAVCKDLVRFVLECELAERWEVLGKTLEDRAEGPK